MSLSYGEKKVDTINAEPVSKSPSISEGKVDDLEDHERLEVFKKNIDGVEFRTVSWKRGVVILVKYTVATGVLGIPSSLNTLGAVGGGLNVLGWGILNSYTSIVAGRVRNNHPDCHTVIDMSRKFWGNVAAEVVSFLYVLGYVLCVAGAVLGISTGLNAVSEHGACTPIFSFGGMVLVVMFSCIRTWSSMTWPLTICFFCVMAAVLAVIIGAAQLDRPAAAPQTGPYDLGFVAIAYPNFAAGITAVNAIFVASTGCPGTITVISEFRRPQDFTKVTIIVGCIVTTIYLTLSMTMYSYTGQWVATPSLGSAGPLVKKIAYGIAMPSLIVSGGLFNHVAAKYVFVRVLRNTKHLQSNSVVHWSTWICLNTVLGVLAFVFAEAVPVFNYLIALLACVCFAPLSIMLPPLLWMADTGKNYWKGTLKEKTIYAAHSGIVLLGIFMCVGGIYGAGVSIAQSAADGLGPVFSCADNSNTVISQG